MAQQERILPTMQKKQECRNNPSNVLPEKSHGGEACWATVKDHNELDTTEQQQTENRLFSISPPVILISIWVFKFLRNCVKYAKSAISLYYKINTNTKQSASLLVVVQPSPPSITLEPFDIVSLFAVLHLTV